MIQTTIAKADEKLVDQLDRELTKIAQAQFESPEFKLLFSAPLTWRALGSSLFSLSFTT
jgi:hypothetical protein